VAVLHQPGEAFEEAEDLDALGFQGLGDGADHRVQPGAVSAGGQYADSANALLLGHGAILLLAARGRECHGREAETRRIGPQPSPRRFKYNISRRVSRKTPWAMVFWGLPRRRAWPPVAMGA